ncbi:MULTISPECIES: shikimate dehydrogenase family protein [Sphingobacterium]|uniref:shikimate dehydrogenase family protein n=1 Tax=Sphingobacterium TaxID=28453 RepID=UPI002244CFEA|nr:MULTISPECIES: shikimate dehydrogenase [Sphingobacterium]MCW8312651.1 shikimate dehydrogenase [Sphingobacterium sp. InxBP1]
MKKLGLIGFPLGHSFSKKYYLEKFQQEDINDVDYDLYPIEHISDFVPIYSDKDFYGVNVTIPYKIEVMGYLDELSEEAKSIQAVNCVRILHSDDGSVYLKGYNTDAYGFETSLKPLLTPKDQKALVLGNGGAAKAVIYALNQLNIAYKLVSRTKQADHYTYEELDASILSEHTVIINCSPVGTYPNITACPKLPYEYINENHLCYDLIYNPEETAFLRKGREQGARTKNGYEMLLLQAEKNWEIWNS